MGMCALGDILQAIPDDLICDIEVVKTHIDYILVLKKENFSKHIDHMKAIFAIFYAAGLK